MLRVLTLSTLYPNAAFPGFGGFVERQTLRLAARDDVDLRVMAPLGVPPFPLDRLSRYAPLRGVARDERWKNVPTCRPRFPLLPAIGWRFNVGLVERAVARVLRRLRADGFVPDVIDAEFFFPDGVAAARLGKALSIPVSIKARGSDIHYWAAKPELRTEIVDAAAAADGLLSVSEALKRDMAALGMPASKIRVHYTGVDLDRFRPVDRAASKAKFGVHGPLVVSIGNLVRLKGHEIVAAAVAKLPGVTLLIAGMGEDEAWLRQRIEALGAGERVRLLGAVPHADMPALLAAADVMALASEREGLANAWVEALACGTPVVAPDIGSAREVIDRPEAGVIVSERTPDAFADAIGRLLADAPEPIAVRVSAERFAWETNTRTLYEHLLALKR
jgi:teichuronic acid biosynthesis glycosyltransferase TuaC